VLALLVGLCGAAPLLIYGFISVAKGWFFIPNSVILKSDILRTPSSMMGTEEMLRSINIRLVNNRAFLTPFIASLVVFVLHLGRRKRFWHRVTLLNALYILAFFPHIALIEAGQC